MLVFIDESGDSGLKVNTGSSPFFTIGLVVFEEHDEATACDQRIDLLKRELGQEDSYEFHFKNNSDKVRERFLQAVSPYNFFYYGIVMNKKNLWGDGFKEKKSFYKYTCSLVFENAKDKLENAIIVIDQSGSLDFKQQLQTYLKKKINTQERTTIKKVKMQDSSCNNLIQLADYVTGAINRSLHTHKKDHDKFRKLISHREIYVQIWPK